jgi:hypothetical protein
MDKRKSRNNIQELGLSANFVCIMCASIVNWQIADILVWSVGQKLANCTSYPI